MSFDSFNLPPPVARAVKDLGFDNPTTIQEKSIPLILEGKDVVGQAETGSGKTAAFGLPTIGRIHGSGIQMLILTPTRELCNQVMQSLSRFSSHLQIRLAAVYGGVGMNPQIHAMRTAQVVVACPGRLLDLVGQGFVDLRHLKFLVIDEADRMFDMGFIRDVEKIIRLTPSNRQTMLFSATMPPQVRSIVRQHMRSPIFVETQTHVDRAKLRECAYEVSQEDKFSLLVHLLKHETPGIALVFCGTRRIVDKVAKALRKQDIDAIPIHGGLTQSQRDHAIKMIHKKGTSVLVATDIAARGLHIPDISHVYNYDLPNVPEDYTHRIGRTARAGAQGDAVTLLTHRDKDLLRPIIKLGHIVSRRQMPQFEKVVMQVKDAHPIRFGGERPHGFKPRPNRFHGARDVDSHRSEAHSGGGRPQGFDSHPKRFPGAFDDRPHPVHHVGAERPHSVGSSQRAFHGARGESHPRQQPHVSGAGHGFGARPRSDSGQSHPKKPFFKKRKFNPSFRR